MKNVCNVVPLMIFFTTCLLLLSYGHFSWDVFLFDDNVCQWYPITEKAYEQFFETGVMPSYNFFLLNGFPIANMGYYSLYNPVMMIAYLLEKIIPFNMFAIYICILCGMGNVIFYLFCRVHAICIRKSVLFTLAYFSAPCFVGFCNWYYTFNNYFIIPLLLYSIFVNPFKKTSYISCGVILAFDLLLGNVQYVCFHYIIYIFVMMGVCAIRKINYLHKMIFNLCVGILLSVPILWLGLCASNDFSNGAQFLSGTTSNSIFFANSIFFLMGKSLLGSPRLSCSAALTIPFILGGSYTVFFVLFRRAEINCLSMRFKESVVILLVILFWLNYNEGGFIAMIMSKLPVISRFRFLFKAFFVIIPLLAIYLCLLESCLKLKRKKILYAVILIFSLVGVSNSFEVYSHTRSLFVAGDDHYTESLYKPQLLKSLDEKNVNYRDYRIASFFSDEKLSKDKHMFDKGLNRNYPSFLGAFSLAAYEIASPMRNLNKINQIYAEKSLITRYGNVGVKSYFLKKIKNNTLQVERQLQDNSVKYLLVKRDSVMPLDTLIQAMSKFEMVFVERVIEFNNFFDLVVLGDIPSLCRFGKNTDVPLRAERMDLLSFESKSAGDYVLSFAFNNKLHAYYMNDEGKKETLRLNENENENILVANVPQEKKVYLIYYDPICQWAKISEIIISILFGVVLLTLFKFKGNVQEC